MTVYLIRHGLTQGNLERRYIGATDQPLCPQGLAQLSACGAPAVDYVYTSPLLRCRQTAERLFPGHQAVAEEDLRECGFGAFENKTYAQLQDDPAYRAWLDTGGTAPPPGGESKASQQQRTVQAFFRLAGRHKAGDRVALVVHGGTIMCLLEELETSHQFYSWQCDNGSGFRCRWNGTNLIVEGEA